MDEEPRSRGNTKIPVKMWLGMALIIAGLLAGAYLSPYLDPFINPERASLMQNVQALKTQNALLKSQVDCLVNGINQNHGKTTVSECT